MKKNVLMFVVMLVAALSMTSCMEYRYVYVPTAPSSTVGTQQHGNVSLGSWEAQKKADEARANAQMRQRQMEEQCNLVVNTVDQTIGDVRQSVWEAQKRADEMRARVRRW